MFFYYGITEIPENYGIIERKAAKGIVLAGDKILLIFNNHGDYKFPGGGLKSGENFLMHSKEKCWKNADVSLNQLENVSAQQLNKTTTNMKRTVFSK